MDSDMFVTYNCKRGLGFGNIRLDYEAFLLECVSMYAVFAPSSPRGMAQPSSTPDCY